MNENVKLDKQKYLLTVRVHNLSHDGRGIGSIDNKTTFIQGALPDETVACKITQKRSTFNEAGLIEIIEPSPQRVSPPCKHFGLCGGCNLQHMSVEMQSLLKQQTLLEQLKHFGNVTPEQILPPLMAQSTGYRRKARLGVKYVIKKEKVLVGFREKSSRYLADLDYCAVLHPKVGEHLQDLRELIASLASYQHIPQIEVAVGDEQVALIFRHLESLSIDDLAKLIAFGEKYQIHIYLQPNPPAMVYKLFPADHHERITYTLPNYQLEYLFHPLDFTQVNLEMNRLMVDQAMRLLDLDPNDQALDLYCGIGNFTLPMAKQAARVTGVEGSAEMVKRASDNAAHNQITNTVFYTGNLMAPDQAAPWLKQTYDKILLDPPRTGAKELLPYLALLKAKRMIYISCNPATLARDAGELVHQQGYQLTAAGIMNMFPHTAHVEAMAVFEKQ